MIASALVLLVPLLSQPPASSCPVSEDAEFATTKTRAVQVGGGPMYVAARERRYLDALRGPSGQTIEYKRTGSMPLEPNGRTFLDRYEVTYAGLEKPIVLYLDAYHFDDALAAPKGFVCAVPIGLNPPSADGFLAQDSLRRLAIAQGGAREIPPISLDGDGSATHGVLLDHFRVMARAARAAKAAGTPLDPENPSPEIARTRMIVVAYPLRCSEKGPFAPVSVDIVPSQGRVPPREGDLATGEALARLLPGLDAPAGSMAAVFPLERPRPIDSIRITYPEGSCGPSNLVVLPVQYTNAKPIKTPAPSLPAGEPPTDRPIRLQALIDVDGAAQEIVYIGGPPALTGAAIDAVRGWAAEPARLNGGPIVTAVMLQVKFGG